jgi:hypothetical protein
MKSFDHASFYFPYEIGTVLTHTTQRTYSIQVTDVIPCDKCTYNFFNGDCYKEIVHMRVRDGARDPENISLCNRPQVISDLAKYYS